MTNESVEATKPQVLPPIKHEWYQSESVVYVTILAKNLNDKNLSITYTENTLNIHSTVSDGLNVHFEFHLEHNIIPDQTQIKYMQTKVEIKLKKADVIQWRKLEIDAAGLSDRIAAQAAKEIKPHYPSSSKNPKNWDKINAELTAEEKDEKLEGDAALNKLFKDVYANGSDETRKAMNKSFLESGGTVLSTNWKDVGAKTLDVKPPDGMEFKKWDS